MGDLRDGWYGNDAYHKWVSELKPIGRGPGGTGEPLTPEQRRAIAQHRFGKGKTEDDWIPSDCVRPSNVASLVAKAMAEAEAMIAKTPGLSGTLADLVVRESVAGADGTVTHRWVPNPLFVEPSAQLVQSIRLPSLHTQPGGSGGSESRLHLSVGGSHIGPPVSGSMNGSMVYPPWP